MLNKSAIGENLRVARENAGLTQTQLAEQLWLAGHGELSRLTIGRIESGRRELGFAEALAIAEALGVPVAQLSTNRVGTMADLERLKIMQLHDEASATLSNLGRVLNDVVRIYTQLKYDSPIVESLNDKALTERHNDLIITFDAATDKDKNLTFGEIERALIRANLNNNVHWENVEAD